MCIYIYIYISTHIHIYVLCYAILTRYLIGGTVAPTQRPPSNAILFLLF